MSDWQTIESAPTDGTVIWAKRMHEGRLVCEGEAVFGTLHEHAPSRQPLGLDPLGRLTAADYAREAEATREWVAEAKWLNPDRMYAFPAPTHWKPQS